MTRITAPLSIHYEEFDLLYEDRYFYIDNRGLTRVHVVLNGLRFKLTVDDQEVRQGANTLLIPRQGKVVIDLFRYMRIGNNRMSVDGEGPPGADAEIIVADQVFGGTVHYVLQLDEVPTDINLSQNYPNPFNLTTTIVYQIPTDLIAGERVSLTVHNLLGERIKTLVDDRRFPGTFTVRWDGVNDGGEVMSSGVYLYRVIAGNRFFMTKRLMLLK